MIKYLENNFNDEIKDKRVLVDFYADWCGPCRMMATVLENVDSIDILKVNIDKFPEIAQRYGVMSIPTLSIFENNNLVKTRVGFMNLDELNDFIK